MDQQSAKVVSLLDFPDELLLRCFANLLPKDLISVGSVSCRLHAVSLDSSIWRPICENLISICQPLAEEGEGVELHAWRAESHFDLWNRLLRKWEKYLGFWIPSTPTPYKELIRISASNRLGAIETMRVHVSNNFDFNLPSIQDGAPHRPLRGSLVVDRFGSDPGIFIASSPEDSDSSMVLFIDKLSPVFVNHFFDIYSLPLGGGSRVNSDPHLSYFPKLSFNWYDRRRLQLVSLSYPPFPSPYLVPALRGAEIDSLGDLTVPALFPKTGHSDWTGDFLPIHSPSSKYWLSSSDIIDNGLYAASYNGHGMELFFVAIRTLSSKDFEHVSSSHSLWPWEGTLAHDDPDFHLGPFLRGTTPNSFISPGSVQPGQRILEVVKLHGDNHVPRGMRSIIGFLDAEAPGSVSADMRAAETEMRTNQSDPRSLKLGLPSISHRNPFKPWPMMAAETGRVNGQIRAMTIEQAMSPGEGWSLHGVGRIAGAGFRDPGWTSCLIHLESRQEFLVWWLGAVTTFKRLTNF